MKEPKWWLDTESLQGSDFAMSTAFSALMRKVFIWMALALVITGVTAYGVATTPSLLIAIVTNKALFWGLIIAELALVFAVARNRNVAVRALFGCERCYVVCHLLSLQYAGNHTDILHHRRHIWRYGTRGLHNEDRPYVAR